jgi:hypothetical protein
MISFVLFLGLLVILFCFSFFTKRRYGVLGLGLAAGALLGANWTDSLTPFLVSQGINIVTPPLSALVQTALVILPPFLLFMNGPSYTKMWSRLLGSALFTLLAFTFLVKPIGAAVFLDGVGLQIWEFFHKYASIFIVIGIVAAIADVLLSPKHKPKK